MSRIGFSKIYFVQPALIIHQVQCCVSSSCLPPYLNSSCYATSDSRCASDGKAGTFLKGYCPGPDSMYQTTIKLNLLRYSMLCPSTTDKIGFIFSNFDCQSKRSFSFNHS